MNYQKLQADILKEMYKNPIYPKRKIVGIAKYKELIAVITQTSIYFIPRILFYLDYEKIVEATKEFTGTLDKMIDFKDLKPATKTDQIKEIPGAGSKKGIVNIFKVEDMEVYIDKKLISYYEDDWKYTYKGINYKNPILIYNDNEEIAGVILPVNPNFINK